MVTTSVSVVTLVPVVPFRWFRSGGFAGSGGSVPVVSLVPVVPFRWLRWFRWFRSGGFVPLFRVLPHALSVCSPNSHNLARVLSSVINWSIVSPSCCLHSQNL